MITMPTLQSWVRAIFRVACYSRWGWYPVVIGVIVWSNYLVQEYRVLGNVVFAFLPVVGSVVMYLWLVLLVDELVDVLGLWAPLERAMACLKTVSLFVVGVYGVLAGLLWANGQGDGSVVRRSVQILATESTRLGFVRYAWWTVRSGGAEAATEKILWTRRDRGDVYVGGDAELVLREGRLSLWRVVEIRRDNEKYYLRMLGAAPSSQVALAGLVQLYAGRREFEKALEWYASLTRFYPNDSDVGYRLGATLVDGRRYKEGAAVFRQVLAARRDYETLYGLGYALAWSGQKREAATYLREATELDPEDYRALYSLGYVLRDTGQFAEARAAWSKVLQLMPNFPEVENNLRAIEKHLRAQQ